MTERRERILRIERTYEAPAERVFEAWTSEEVMRRWFHGRRDMETPVAEVDLRIGGRVRVVMRRPETGFERGATGEYTLIDPPHRLSFSWVWDDDPDNPQLIELEFTERDGVTTAVMVNSAIPTDEKHESQRKGWETCFDNLERALSTSSS